jgi:hypothetical protein
MSFEWSDSIPSSNLEKELKQDSHFARFAFSLSRMERTGQGSDVAVLENRASVLPCSAGGGIHHGPRQVVGANHLVGKQHPERGVSRAQPGIDAQVKDVYECGAVREVFGANCGHGGTHAEHSSLHTKQRTLRSDSRATPQRQVGRAVADCRAVPWTHKTHPYRYE